jgi:hypothetical protein
VRPVVSSHRMMRLLGMSLQSTQRASPNHTGPSLQRMPVASRSMPALKTRYLRKLGSSAVTAGIGITLARLPATSITRRARFGRRPSRPSARSARPMRPPNQIRRHPRRGNTACCAPSSIWPEARCRLRHPRNICRPPSASDSLGRIFRSSLQRCRLGFSKPARHPSPEPRRPTGRGTCRAAAPQLQLRPTHARPQAGIGRRAPLSG